MDEQLRLDDTAATWREVDDVVVALRLTDSMYLGVNSSGARLWELLSRGASRAELIQELVATFGLDRDINVGDTSAADERLDGYLDNVVVETLSGDITWDFEAKKDACKDGGHANYGFASQGDCVSHVQANAKAGK